MSDSKHEVLEGNEYYDRMYAMTQALESHREQVINSAGRWDHMDTLAEIYSGFEDAVQHSLVKLDEKGEKKFRGTMEYGGRTIPVPDVWREGDSFEEFCQYTKWFMERQLEFAKGFKEERKTPLSHMLGDDLAANMEMTPKGMTKEYSAEQYEILEFLVRKQIESIEEYLHGRIPLEKIIAHYLALEKEDGNVVGIKES